MKQRMNTTKKKSENKNKIFGENNIVLKGKKKLASYKVRTSICTKNNFVFQELIVYALNM